MTDQEKQAMIDKMVVGELCVKALSENEFYGLLSGLTRMYFARVLNCCDASGRMDTNGARCQTSFRECVKKEKEV